jgi:hypothetical protein
VLLNVLRFASFIDIFFLLFLPFCGFLDNFGLGKQTAEDAEGGRRRLCHNVTKHEHKVKLDTRLLFQVYGIDRNRLAHLNTLNALDLKIFFPACSKIDVLGCKNCLRFRKGK